MNGRVTTVSGDASWLTALAEAKTQLADASEAFMKAKRVLAKRRQTVRLIESLIKDNVPFPLPTREEVEP